MATRNIRIMGDPILEKQCRPVKEMNLRNKILVKDMLDTMYEADGVGLAAPQVGVLRRIVVIDVTAEKNSPVILINPEVIETDGEQTGGEGCLSIPGKTGIVTRPNHVKVRALNEAMEEITVEGEALMARALCHEIDHLNGQLYVKMVEGELIDNEDFEEAVKEDDE